MRALSAITLAAVLAAPALAAPDAPLPAGATPQLEGWGPYKFGMTGEEVLHAGPLDWHTYSAQAEDRSFDMVGDRRGEVDQFGLKPWSVVAEFDGDRRLSGIFLDNHRGGLTEEGCKARFEDLLTRLEAQFGVFEPGDDIFQQSFPQEKSDETRSLPGGQSRYRDIVRWNLQSPIYNPDTKLFRASAKQVYGERSLAVEMGVVVNMKIDGLPGGKIPDAVLALAPNLANPACSLKITFRAKNPMLLPAAPPPPAPTPAPATSADDAAAGLGNLLSAVNQGAPPSQFVQAFQNFMDIVKKLGLDGPIDPILDAYIRARAAHDDEDEAMLLGKMTPAQTADAADIRSDHALALKLWTPLAEKGDAHAAASIASLYEYGPNGVTQDYVQAAQWRRRAASEGDGESQVALGNDFAGGRGVTKDNVRAYTWLSLGLDKTENEFQRGGITKKRDAVAAQMSAAELVRAKAMTDRCWALKHKGCN